MDTAVRTTRTRAALDRTTLLLAVGDVAVVAGLLLFGYRQHGGTLTEPLAAAETIAPFLLGWLVAAPLAGGYAPDVASSATRAARVTTVAWLAAANVGLLLRSSPLFEGGAAWPFTLVITGTGIAVLVAWRVGYALYANSAS